MYLDVGNDLDILLGHISHLRSEAIASVHQHRVVWYVAPVLQKTVEEYARKTLNVSFIPPSLKNPGYALAAKPRKNATTSGMSGGGGGEITSPYREFLL